MCFDANHREYHVGSEGSYMFLGRVVGNPEAEGVVFSGPKLSLDLSFFLS